MSRIKPADDRAAAGSPSSDGSARELGEAIDAIWAHRQAAYRGYVAARRELDESATLSPRLIELVRLRIAFHNQCSSCMAVRNSSPDLRHQARVTAWIGARECMRS